MKKSTVIYLIASILSGCSVLLSYSSGMDDGFENGLKVGMDTFKPKKAVDPINKKD